MTHHVTSDVLHNHPHVSNEALNHHVTGGITVRRHPGQPRARPTTDVEVPVGQESLEEVDQVGVLHVAHDLYLGEEERQAWLPAQVDVLHGHPSAGGSVRGQTHYPRGAAGQARGVRRLIGERWGLSEEEGG